jgi:sugar (pentulose or hexulose) kinase
VIWVTFYNLHLNEKESDKMKETVIAIFDIGKTNKKLLLFNTDLKVISETEQRFDEINDDDGFGCDDIEHIEQWIKESVTRLIHSDKYDLEAVNFTTYGATVVYLDEDGRRLTPVYNYLKPMEERISENLYKKYGGRDEFCRRTASPALGMLNSGMQPLWLKAEKPEIFAKIKNILHFPQYLSYTLTGKIYSEHTSIGCHTALWDFDNMNYHPWVKAYGLDLQEPVPVETTNEVEIDGKKLLIGIGIHDSSASLAPYFSSSKGKFLLLSTGTWCINMNPFNTETLTSEQLDRDCLCYLSITRQPVKSSRFFLGHLHETATKQISAHFRKPEDYFKKVRLDKQLITLLKARNSEKKIFFKPYSYSRDLNDSIDMYEFASFEEAYHQLMIELCEFTVESINLILASNDETVNIYITGGFSGNKLFLHFIREAFPSKKVWTSEIRNASALGAALVISGASPVLNLGLAEY